MTARIGRPSPLDDAGDPYTDAVHAAFGYARRGWYVFPLVPGEKRPAVRHWQDRATVDPARIERCWTTRTAAGPYGIGIACGPSRLVVVDLDIPKPTTELPEGWRLPGVVDGADVLAVLADRAGAPDPALSGTYAVTTPTGGRHLYFTAPTLDEPAGARPLGNTAGALGPLVDTRAAGGYVVAPPTRVVVDPAARPEDGRDTRGPTRSGYVVDDPAATVRPLPAWLLDELLPAPLPPQRATTVALTARALAGGPPAGAALAGRGVDERGDRYVRAAVDRTLSALLEAAPGTRNRALYGAAVSLGQLVAGGALDEATTTAVLVDAGTHLGQTPRAAAATVRSGLRAGGRRPRVLEPTPTPSTPRTTTPGAAA